MPPASETKLTKSCSTTLPPRVLSLVSLVRFLTKSLRSVVFESSELLASLPLSITWVIANIQRRLPRSQYVSACPCITTS